MQPCESNAVFSPCFPGNIEWNWSTFSGFGPTTWPSDTRRSINSDSSCCKTVDESAQGASRQDLFSTRTRSFRAWTIKLNGDNELVVEGTLDCGSRARSKPITGRVTATKILSKMNHIYRLVGEITDQRDELPGFVRNRFNAGFPQDWEVVVAIWKGFVSSESLNSTMKSSYMLQSFAAEKKLRLDTTMEYESQDDRMSRTMSDVKQLSSWSPFVVSHDSGESCLAFRGTLLSPMGYSVNKNHRTNIICRRLSARIIETVDREFYELIGDLNNTKHSVPKELVMLCRNGCPRDVYSFCEKWKSLTSNETEFNGSLRNGKCKRKTRQDQSISLVTCHKESKNFITNCRSNSMSPKRCTGGPIKRKRPFMELSENCIADDASIDNNDDKKLQVRKRYKIIRKISTNSSETSSGDKEDIAKGNKSKIFQVRPIVRKETNRQSPTLKPMPTMSFVYHKISPPTENVLSDGV